MLDSARRLGCVAESESRAGRSGSCALYLLRLRAAGEEGPAAGGPGPGKAAAAAAAAAAWEG